MTYDEALRFWYSRINYEVRAAKPEDLKLERMCELLDRLGNPQDRLRIVHLAGTKGKGSTAAMIAAFGRAAGLNVGLFTSPHLEAVEERIQVNGVPIATAELAEFIAQIRPVVEVMDAGPYSPVTFFEIVTALGWLHFVRHKVDLAVMEVGLGGRFDSTNACRPAVAVITSIGYDHTAQLGNTLEAIAFQKAGIVKPGVPCLLGVMDAGPRAVIRREAGDVGAPLREAGVHFPERYDGALRLIGEHQRRNAALAVEAIRMLNIEPVAAALSNMDWPARIEVVRTAPVVILDCSHNVPSVEALVATLQAEFGKAKARTCIFAVSNDKQYAEMLPILAAYFDRFILTRYGQNPRCVPPEALADLLPSTVAKAIVVPAITAYEIALCSANAEDLIGITGSVFLAGELRAALRGH